MSVRGVESTRCALGHPSTSAHLGEEHGVSKTRYRYARPRNGNKGLGEGQSLPSPASDARDIGRASRTVEPHIALCGSVLGHESDNMEVTGPRS